MSSQLANKFLLNLLKKEIDFDVDTFKIILMGAGFVFNRATHDEYSDVSASELATQYGYTTGGATLSGVTVSQDDVNNLGKVTWTNANWTAAGGNIVASGAIIYDDSTTPKYIVGYIDFEGTQTTNDGGIATVANPSVAIAG